MSGEETAIGRGSRRKKLAGYLKQANELRQSYTQAYLGSGTRSEFSDEDDDIPGAFPGVKVARSGKEELILFPSYARRHTKAAAPDYPIPADQHDANGSGDADYWRREWEVFEDANAVVDVDVRGWIYTPHRGPMNRKNRIILGIARHLSGIPAPQTGGFEATRHEDRIAERQAEDINKRVEEEADYAGRGGLGSHLGYGSASSSRSVSPRPGQIQHPVTDTSIGAEAPGPGYLRKTSSWGSVTTDLSPEELAIANTQLLRRLKPFFSTPAAGMSITIFYFNDDTSQSRTTHTNDSGHFNFRAALNFIPTHVRVLASQDLSAVSDVIITEPTGVSLISDIDDTIKHSAIGSGAREIFRNAFVRDLGDLVIEGVREWYHIMSDMGVKIHYVSNSPWQMYPLLVTYFDLANLPPGSFHLKQYTGMLQGIFEPVAERKKATLDRILGDFPDRKFILVGDSGEADLELYVETALRDPKRILAIFIRDVSTSHTPAFFDTSGPSKNSFDGSNQPFQPRPAESTIAYRQRPSTTSRTESISEPEAEDLMTFSDDEKPESTSTTRARPPPPKKPASLRSTSESMQSGAASSLIKKPAPPPPPSRTATTGVVSRAKAAYNTLPTAREFVGLKSDINPSIESESSSRTGPPLPPRRGLTSYPAAAANYASTRVSSYWNGNEPTSRSSSQPPPINKREELWNRRLARARELLSGKGILLKTWRVGADVEKEAIRLVQKEKERRN